MQKLNAKARRCKDGKEIHDNHSPDTHSLVRWEEGETPFSHLKML